MHNFSTLDEQLEARSYAVLDLVLDEGILNALRTEALDEYRAGEFHEAAIGKGIAKQRMQEVRSDQVLWLDRNTASKAQAAYWALMDALRIHLSNYFRIHLERTELHYAVYPTGAYYSAHLDQFRAHSNRVFSVITYLNPEWKIGDGGELRIHHADGRFDDIEPLHGRLICFRSDEVLHEVLLANKPRVSLTGWMRRDPLIF
jgi:SM-20-related protein